MALMYLGRYAYFKKLTYFSTECIYSPDGEFHVTFESANAGN